LSPSFGTRPIPKGPAFLSPEWRELFRHAMREAERLGMEAGINLGAGWRIGGHWINPEIQDPFAGERREATVWRSGGGGDSRHSCPDRFVNG
jgi:hypothetical protein